MNVTGRRADFGTLSAVQLEMLRASHHNKKVKRLLRRGYQDKAIVSRKREIDVRRDAKMMKLNGESITGMNQAAATALGTAASVIGVVGAFTGVVSLGIGAAVALALMGLITAVVAIVTANAFDKPAARLDKEGGELGLEARALEFQAADAKEEVDDEVKRASRTIEANIAMRRRYRELQAQLQNVEVSS